ncbi:MAG: N-acetylmuramoyl-L-alanine amidase [Sphingomonadaceae bacterium]
MIDLRYRYQLGFLELANALGRDLVGYPLENEHHAANGDGQQRTTKGLFVWRKADNWTAFTDGYRTWLRGPGGLVYERLNSERFDWELDGYRPTVYSDPVPAAAIAGRISATPRGIILHGTRSGRRQSRFLEFHGTRAYARAGCGGQYLGWHLTVGEDEISEHLPLDRWGYHAREWWSEHWIGIEFAQPTDEYTVTEKQVRAAVWWIKHRLLVAYPDMPLELLAHSEIDPGIRDGKTDVYPRGDRRTDELRDRIRSSLKAA